MPDRIRHLVYLDAVLVQSGQNFLDSWPSDAAEARRKAAREINGVRVLPAPSPAPPKAGTPEDPVTAWVQRRLTPYPFAPFETPLVLTNPIGNGRPCTYSRSRNPQPRSGKKPTTGTVSGGLAVGGVAPEPVRPGLRARRGRECIARDWMKNVEAPALRSAQADRDAGETLISMPAAPLLSDIARRRVREVP